MSLAPVANRKGPEPSAQSSVITHDERRVLVASSLGNVFEWYDI